eukprot:jgi/Mesen1/10729/ME000090S10191
MWRHRAQDMLSALKVSRNNYPFFQDYAGTRTLWRMVYASPYVGAVYLQEFGPHMRPEQPPNRAMVSRVVALAGQCNLSTHTLAQKAAQQQAAEATERVSESGEIGCLDAGSVCTTPAKGSGGTTTGEQSAHASWQIEQLKLRHIVPSGAITGAHQLQAACAQYPPEDQRAAEGCGRSGSRAEEREWQQESARLLSALADVHDEADTGSVVSQWLRAYAALVKRSRVSRGGGGGLEGGEGAEAVRAAREAAGGGARILREEQEQEQSRSRRRWRQQRGLYVGYREVAMAVNGAMKELGLQGRPRMAYRLFQWMQGQGWCQLDPHLSTTIITILARSQAPAQCVRIFTSMLAAGCSPDTPACNALLACLLASEHPAYGMLLFETLKSGAVPPTIGQGPYAHAYAHPQERHTSQGTGESPAADVAEEEEESEEEYEQAIAGLLQRVVEAGGCRADTVTYNTLMDAAVKGGQGLAGAIGVLKEMRACGAAPDVVTYDVLISACAREGKAREAETLMRMIRREGLQPTVVTLTALVHALAAAGEFKAAKAAVRSSASEFGCRPNAVTFSTLISALAARGHLADAEQLLDEMEATTAGGSGSSIVPYNALLAGYAAAGLVDGAEAVMGRIGAARLTPSVVTFTSLMAAYSNAGSHGEVWSIYREMQAAGCAPNVQAFTAALSAASRQCHLARVARILQDMRDAGCAPNAYTSSAALCAISCCDDLSQVPPVLDALAGFQAPLSLNIICALCSAPHIPDSQVRELTAALVESIDPADSHTPTVLTSALIDALYALGLQRRAALVLAAAMSAGLHVPPSTSSSNKRGDLRCVWKLDVRRLSRGGAVLALHQWLSCLALLAQAGHRYDARGNAQDVEILLPLVAASSVPRPVLRDSSWQDSHATGAFRFDGGQRSVSKDRHHHHHHLPAGRTGQRARPEKGTTSQSHVKQYRRRDEESLLLEAEVEAFPSSVEVVTGWGKNSKREGECPVRDAVGRQVAHLGAPLRPPPGMDELPTWGRLMASGRALREWLLLPATAPSLALHDDAFLTQSHP